MARTLFLSFCIWLQFIFYAKQENGMWRTPESAPFIAEFGNLYLEPHITSDGARLMVLLDKSEKGRPPNEEISAADRKGDSLGMPYNVGAPVYNQERAFFPSTTLDGTLYFPISEKNSRLDHIFRSRF